MKAVLTDNLERLEQIKELMAESVKEFTLIPAVKYFETYNEFINSEELEEAHRGFQSKTSINESMFKGAIVDEEGKVWVKYVADGINFVKKETVGSYISNGGLYEVIALPVGMIVLKDKCYDKGENNRKIWRAQGQTLIDPYSLRTRL
jgi:hypothetical protein